MFCMAWAVAAGSLVAPPQFSHTWKPTTATITAAMVPSTMYPVVCMAASAASLAFADVALLVAMVLLVPGVEGDPWANLGGGVTFPVAFRCTVQAGPPKPA